MARCWTRHELRRRRQEFLALMHALEEEPHHVQHVAMLAVHLFDEVEDLHGLGDQDRLLLEAASCLHDIGWSAAPDGKGHHRESARIIREHRWKHFNSANVALMAQVARYHRKNLPIWSTRDSPRSHRRAPAGPATGVVAAHRRRTRPQPPAAYPASQRGHFSGQIVIHLNASHPASREVASATRRRTWPGWCFSEKSSSRRSQDGNPVVV